MREIVVREKLESIGQRLCAHLDDIRRTTCPRCHLANLRADIEGTAILVECTTPQVLNKETCEYETCDFYVIVNGTPATALPDLSVTREPQREQRPAPKRRRAQRKRSR